ncbi:hypothetical protein PMAYCL1PPCAC_14399 [Pristionchus mayeri]|uniref:Uncharacterized protein n=1 Tax=Pristionchus mayeri TaxID=1317129 RepID=A0AAN4ZRQ0_9BILA|nr:hypothetical protein PMAYCL1PPCAC_14399 [Pristionchus mayeri]
MFELLRNSLDDPRMRYVKGARVWSSLRLKDEYPTIVIDMHYVFDGQHERERTMKRQLSTCISNNMLSYRPLPLILSNVPDNESGKHYMEKKFMNLSQSLMRLGYWSGKFQHEMILPDVEKGTLIIV